MSLVESIKALPELELAEFMQELNYHLIREKMQHLNLSVDNEEEVEDLQNQIDDLEEEIKAIEKERDDFEEKLDQIKSILK